MPDHPTDPALPTPSRARVWLTRLLPLVVLAVAVFGGYVLLKTPPQAKSRPTSSPATLVEVQPVKFLTQPVRINAMGSVQPARTVDLMPRVGGEIQSVSPDFIPGGTFEKGDELVRIDPLDYELAKRTAETFVTEARTNLRIEQGSQAVARQDFELLGEIVGEDDQDLVLRKPQLEMAEANLASALADLERAEVDLARATVEAPFNAIVEGRPLDIGARVTSTTTLATLIGTDHYWIEATVPVQDIKWISFPGPGDQEGSTVKITDEDAWGPDQFRTGTVKRLAASLEEQGRMARVIIEVEDPLGLTDPDLPRLLIGSFVRVEFEGRILENAAVLSRAHLHANDEVWTLADDDTLDIRPVEVALRGRDFVTLASGLNPDDRIVTTDLSAPVQGMPLRTEAGDRGVPTPSAQPTTNDQ